MLYSEAYELIDIILQKQATSVPLNAKLKQRLFSDSVLMMNKIYVRNIEEEVFAGGSTKYVFTKENASDRIYQISLKTDGGYQDIPFAPQSVITNPDEMLNPSYFVRKENSLGGQFKSITTSTNIVETWTPHGLSIGDYVELYQVPTINIWFENDNGTPIRHKVTSITSSTIFKIEDSVINGLSQSGLKSAWRQNQLNLIFSKAPVGTISVRYYADPLPNKNFNDPIDLPETLCKASVYCCLKELFLIDGQLENSKAMIDISTLYEDQYSLESTTRQPQIDKLTMPLQDFT